LNKENKELIGKCDELNSMISTARRKLMKEEIDAKDFKIIKDDCEKEIRYLESKLTSSSIKSDPADTIIEQVMERVSRLDVLYQNGSVYQKRVIISSIYPGNLVFDGVEHRTFRMNEVIQLICSVDKHFKEIKKETNCDFSQMSLRVSPQGLEPWTR
jgi:site-specific DNA recombinase